MQQKLIFVFIIALVGGCVYPFEIDLRSDNKIMVIEGLVSNLDGPQKVSITYTKSFDSPDSNYVSGANVWVEDQNGTIHQYTETGNGNYLSMPDFCGMIGNSYQLFIEIDGSTYQSGLSVLTEPTPVDSLHGRIEQVINTTTNSVDKGIQFFLDAHSDAGGPQYFRYEWSGTHEIQVPFPGTHKVENSEIVEIEHRVSPCYNTRSSNSIILASTVGFTESRVADVPIQFVAESSTILRHAYSLYVRQYSLSQEAYLFYKQLLKNNETGGSLFAPQQGTLRGNITSVDDPDKEVLGFFEVSGATEKRRMFRRSGGDFNGLAVPRFPYLCGPGLDCTSGPECVDTLQTDPQRAITMIEESFYGAAQIYYYEPMSMPPAAFVHKIECTDCSWYASNVRPDFWEN